MPPIGAPDKSATTTGDQREPNAITSTPIEAELELRYLNSASTKMVFKLVGLLDQAASAGRKVRLRFVVLDDDEMLQDLGADMRADFSWLDFEFVETAF